MAIKQTARMEDYLEAIYELKKEEGVAKISSIGRRLDVTMPTVNSAINRLSDKKLVKHDRYGDVELTPEGLEIGREVSRRHHVLALFLSRILGVDEETSRRDACEIEHSLSPETADRLASLVGFILEAPRTPEWLKNFDYYYRHGKRPRECYERFDDE
ncbi:MAG: metal-dependent transcriptional regulator [Actinomycetota bacterium]